MTEDIEARLSAARTRLILDRPFLGALVLRLPLEIAHPTWCPTIATDARKLYYNPEYIAGLSLAQVEFTLAHEALHCGLAHFARRAHREKHRWDNACDFAINPLLVAEGMTPPPKALFLADYEGMSAEEIYPLLEDDSVQQTHDRHLYDDPDDRAGDADSGHDRGGEHDASPGGRPPPLAAAECQHLEHLWRQRLAGAAQQALQADRLGGVLARMIDTLLQPQLPWRSLLARHMALRARDDFTYARPGRREGEAILPSLRNAAIDVTVALDTSGSISKEEIDQFVSEIDALKGQVRARVNLLACDACLAPGSPWVFEPWEPLSLPETLSGGGGTDFLPVFDWAKGCDSAPDLLVYFTDGQGRFPGEPPALPVIWLVKGRADVPWGERIQLN